MANIKARDLDGLFRTHGSEKATIMALTHLIERMNDFEAGLTVLGQLLDKQTDIITDFSTVAGNMRDTIEGMK